MGSTLYDNDYYQWATEQASHLAAHRVDLLDWEHLSEEIEDLGRSEYRGAASLVEQVIIHLLYVKYWQIPDCMRGWQNEVATWRLDLQDDLSTSILAKLRDNQTKIYQKARRKFELKSGLSAPDTCPWSLEEIIGSE